MSGVAVGQMVTADIGEECPCGCGLSGERRAVVIEVHADEIKVACPDGAGGWLVFGCDPPSVRAALYSEDSNQ